MSDDWSTWGSTKGVHASYGSPRAHRGREAIPAAVAHPSRSSALPHPPGQQNGQQATAKRSNGQTMDIEIFRSIPIYSIPIYPI